MPSTWESEYQSPQFITKHDQPQKCFLRYVRWLKKDRHFQIPGSSVLDLGCGVGRNSNYLAENGAKAYGIDISPTAIEIARERAEVSNIHVDYREGNVGEPYPYEDASFDLVLDVTCSNALSEAERTVYLQEVTRVLRPGGHFFVRTLCKDGDHNAKKLLKLFPGGEPDCYILPGLDFVERVFSEADFLTLYGQDFIIHSLTKEIGYSRFQNQNYKRSYWLAYLEKKYV